MQALGEVVWPVVERLGDPKHLGPGFCAQAPVGVQRLGRGADRHASQPGDVANCSRARRARLLVELRAVAEPIVHFTPPDSRPEM